MNNTKKIKAIFEIILIISVIFSVYSVKPVNAEDYGCCEKTSNNYCIQGTQDICDSVFIPGVSCSSTDICKIGTCIINNQCFANYPKSKCTNLNGQWHNQQINNIQECRLGCCVQGSNCQLKTQTQCTSLVDLQPNFLEDIQYQSECSLECLKEDQGCCVYGDGVYTYIIREQCSNLDGDFKLNQYCSSIPQSNCRPHDHTECEGLSLYSYDSCGNKESLIQKCNYPNEVCAKDINDQNNNGNKDESICKSTNCRNTYNNPLMNNDGGDRVNGESWCEYQSASGPGLDLPGSIHYKHYCMDGVEYAQACGSDIGNREEICIYANYSVAQGSPGMIAQCRENRYESCPKQKNKKDCENSEKRDCAWISSKSQGKKSCVPLVPIGFTREDRKDENAVQVCDKGDWNIKTSWTSDKGADGKTTWSCQENCEAFDGNTLKSTNFYCMAQGDCGASINIADEFTDSGYTRYCTDGMPNGRKERPRCIPQISESFWHKYYDSLTIKNKGMGLYFGNIDVKNYMTTEQFLKAEEEWVTSLAAIGLAYGIFGGPLGMLMGAVIGAALGVIGGVLDYLITPLLTKQKTVKLPIRCRPYEIPDGGKDCGKCSAPKSEGGLLPDINGDIISGYHCQKYTCQTLGTACKFIEDSTDGSVCVKSECNDVSYPKIKLDSDLLKQGNLKCCTDQSEQVACNPIDCRIDDKGENVGYDITDNVNELKTFSFGIDTYDNNNRPLYTKCYYSDSPTRLTQDEDGQLIDVIDTMEPLSDGAASLHHNITIAANYLASSGENEFAYYIRCRTANECSNKQENPVDYVIKFKIHTGPDTTAPIIEYIEPENGLVANTENEKEVSLRISEVLSFNDVLDKAGGCRWSDQNLDYNLMSEQNQTICYDPGMYENQECTAQLTGINNGLNTFYFSCIDPAGNAMSPYAYILTKTQALNISSILPVSIDCNYGSEINCYTNNLTLKVETINGAENGKSICYWSNECQDCADIEFFSTNSAVHEQPNLEFYRTGSYDYYAKCEDIAGNTANANVKFFITVDSEAPKLISINHDLQYNKLKVLVDDVNPVSCEYSNIEFLKGQGTNMDSIGNAFFAEWNQGIYYIRCTDKFGNEMPLAVIHTSSIK